MFFFFTPGEEGQLLRIWLEFMRFSSEIQYASTQQCTYRPVGPVRAPARTRIARTVGTYMYLCMASIAVLVSLHPVQYLLVNYLCSFGGAAVGPGPSWWGLLVGPGLVEPAGHAPDLCLLWRHHTHSDISLLCARLKHIYPSCPT